jgi:hypothetical protein
LFIRYISDSNKLADFNNINKEFLPKTILPKKSSQKKSMKNPKNSSKKSRKNPKNFQTISQKVPNFENIQFPTSHLEAENPFGLVLCIVFFLT